jgi:hypothetical protein
VNDVEAARAESGGVRPAQLMNELDVRQHLVKAIEADVVGKSLSETAFPTKMALREHLVACLRS